MDNNYIVTKKKSQYVICEESQLFGVLKAKLILKVAPLIGFHPLPKCLSLPLNYPTQQRGRCPSSPATGLAGTAGCELLLCKGYFASCE